MIIRERIWFPMLGDYQEWIVRERKEIHDSGFKVVKEDPFDTYTGSTKVHFTIEKEESHGNAN